MQLRRKYMIYLRGHGRRERRRREREAKRDTLARRTCDYEIHEGKSRAAMRAEARSPRTGTGCEARCARCPKQEATTYSYTLANNRSWKETLPTDRLHVLEEREHRLLVPADLRVLRVREDGGAVRDLATELVSGQLRLTVREPLEPLELVDDVVLVEDTFVEVLVVLLGVNEADSVMVDFAVVVFDTVVLLVPNVAVAF